MIAYLLIIIVAFSIVAASVIQLVGEYLFNQRVREEERVTGELAQQFAPMLASYDSDGMYALAFSVAQKNEARVLVLDAFGSVQVDSMSALNGRMLTIRQVANVLAGEGSDYGYYRAETASRFLMDNSMSAGAITGVCACAMTNNGSLLGVTVYVSAVQEVYDGLMDVTRQIAFILLAVFAVVGALSVFMARVFTHPVGELSEGIQQMSRGDFTVRVPVRGNNEFSDLARAFNTMSQRMATLDRSRNQFVSNASHELKTPLTTMKILLQTLLYQEEIDPKLTHEFLTDIDKEIDRLSAVVSDLLTLVSIDSGEAKMNFAPLNLRDLVGENVKRLSPLARERGIELEFNARESVELTGDSMKLTQVFYNLIDNAVKYTPRGGNVMVDMTRQGKNAIVRVSDNGIGIPEEDQLHIFDRFYRVDKARSRETGGTGLGLSIVKQILLMHHGSIGVTSREGEGTTFTVEIPIASAKQTGGRSA